MPQPLILLVDDAPDIGVIVRRFGRQVGQTVAVEPSAEAAWLYLRNARRPDLAVLDVNLPGASGFDLCRQIRGEAGLANLPVALFSHWLRPADVAAALEAGTNFLLSKDLLCQPDAWRQRIAEILQPPAGRFPPFFLRWLNGPPPTLAQLAQQFGTALATAAGGWLDAEVIRCLVGRARCQTGSFALSTTELPAADYLAAVVAQVSPQDLPAFLHAFVEHTWCLLGTADCAPFWAVLAAATPPECESPPPP